MLTDLIGVFAIALVWLAVCGALLFVFACCLIRAIAHEAFRWRLIDMPATDNPNTRVRLLQRRYPTKDERDTLTIETWEAYQHRKGDGL